MTEPIFSPEARRDLVDAFEYVGEKSQAAAENLIRKVREIALKYVALPQMGRPREDLRPGPRSFVVKPYVVFYRPLDDTIEIVRVLHGRRDIESIFHDDTN